MQKLIAAALAAILATSATAGGLFEGMKAKTAKQQAGADLGPFYLGVNGHCDVFKVWYNQQFGTLYGSEVGCVATKTGQPVIGTIDTNGYEVYLSVGGQSKSVLLDTLLDSRMVMAWAVSDGSEPAISLTGVTLGTAPIAEGGGTSVLQ